MKTRIMEWLLDGFQMPTRVSGTQKHWDGKEYIQRVPDISQLSAVGRMRYWLISVLAK